MNFEGMWCDNNINRQGIIEVSADELNPSLVSIRDSDNMNEHVAEVTDHNITYLDEKAKVMDGFKGRLNKTIGQIDWGQNSTWVKNNRIEGYWKRDWDGKVLKIEQIGTKLIVTQLKTKAEFKG